MAQENAEMRARIELHHSRGRDAKALTPEIEEARAAVRRKSLADKAETERALAEENAEMRRRLPSP